jgi:eukaryotic-like serine/threonine-protein kinase
MWARAKDGRLIRFGVFELDLQAGELRRNGQKVRLQEQPFRVLNLLLERPGEVVARDELRRTLWPDGTFVDFDHGLHTAINKLREALGDLAESPRYVETVPKRGYRFVAPVERMRDDSLPLTAAEKSRRIPLERILVAALIIALGVIGAMWWAMRDRAAAGRHVHEKFAFSPPGGAESPVISPDGKHIAYVSGSGEQSRLWIQDLDRFEPREVTHSAGALDFPFWSFDSQQIGFAANHRLWRAPTAGGDPVIVCEIPDEYLGGTWNPDGGSIVMAVDHYGLLEVPARGGTPKLILKPDPQRWKHFDAPRFLPPPHSALLLLTAPMRTGQHVSVLHSLSSGRQEVVSQDGGAVYLPAGYLVYPRESLLWARPFSPGAVKRTGEGFPIAQALPKAVVSVSLEDTLTYEAGQLRWQMRWRDRHGRELDTQDSELCISGMALSPAGTRAAACVWEKSQMNLWIWDFARHTRTRMFWGPGNARNPVWHPSGKMVAFSSSRRGNWDIYMQPADGSSPATVLAAGPLDEVPQDWSADGKVLVYSVADPGTKLDLWYRKQNNDNNDFEFNPIVQSPWQETAGALSPDGRFLAYQSDESGRHEVYVRRFPDGGGRQQVSSGGGIAPRWRRDGKELFYLAGDTLMAAAVTTVPTFSAAVAKALFQESNVNWGSRGDNWRVFDPSPDGQRFLFAVPEKPGHSQIRVVRNWSAEFKDRVSSH